MNVEYEYGSKPSRGYNYECFIKSIAPILPKNDKVFYYNGKLNWRRFNDIPLDLFRNICHWKSPRPFTRYVCKNGQSEVNERWKKALQYLIEGSFHEISIENALSELVKLKGVAVPTASALLTAWNPDKFGIIDFKVLDVLGIAETATISSYTKFRNQLLVLRNKLKIGNCSLRQIELAIWHYYPIQYAGKVPK